MQKHRKKGKRVTKRTKKSCTPPVNLNDTEIKAKLKYHKRRTVWIKKEWKMRQADPRISEALILGITERVTSLWQLHAQGVNVSAATTGFPPGTNPWELSNYSSIVRAFSRTFGPQLFKEMGMADPYPWNNPPYWSNFFFQIAPYTQDGLLEVVVFASGTDICFGDVGTYQVGGPMWIYDCTEEADIFHEIGHAVMDDGIMKKRAPVYFSYATGKVINGVPEIIDAKELLTSLFGKPNLDNRKDIDGVKIGFISDYATTNIKEDFADTFKYYVYYPSTLWEKIQRQEDMGSNILSRKASLIAGLYSGMWFNDYGVPAGWPGYSL